MHRRVVVTGLGAVTPLATGISETWKRLINGESAITSLSNLEIFASSKHKLPSQVGAIVQRGKLSNQFDFSKYDYHVVSFTHLLFRTEGWAKSI